ncbi:hypothetical protein LPJ59_006577 [Coemansia sp. RSA 2399]|nr:hypothetical protein LPJ59_006577 [Coemansia sp. RSA 2399]
MDPSKFCKVANTLLQEYKEHTNPGIVTSRSGKTVVHMPSEEFTISSMSPEYFKQSAFLNLMLSAGYLTARSPTTVGIPNGELQRVWESILKRVLLRGVSIGQGGALKSKVLNEFYRGKTDCFHTLMETAIKNISERTDKYGEMEYAHVAVSAITCMERTGIYTHTDQPDISDVDITMSRGPAAGTGYVDWVMLLHSTKNVRTTFAMIVKLRHIPNEEIHNEELGKAKAEEGIDQIDEERYGALIENCVECIHIGMAVGLNTVHMASRMFKRDNAKSKGTPTESLL